MCVISVSLKGKKFSEADLKKMWDSNPHGAGVAVLLPNGKVRVRKGFMHFDELMEFYDSEICEGMIHALHFRFRSTGEILPQLTHPFRVDSVDEQKLKYQARAVLFHNGTVSDWKSLFLSVLATFKRKDREKILALKSISDTYVASLLVFRFGTQIIKHLDLGGKWLVFAPKPVFFGSWDEDRKNGFKFSNLSWKHSLNVRYSYIYGSIPSGWKGTCDCDWCKKEDDDV